MSEPNFFALSTYRYDLPPGLIAQVPAAARDQSRLMIIDRRTGEIQDAVFADIRNILGKGDSLVLNDTKVIPARLYGLRESGGRCEILLVRPLGDDRWQAMARPGKKLRPGSRVTFAPDFFADIEESASDGTKVVRLHYQGDLYTVLDKQGQLPLPPYIEREKVTKEDLERYQTVFASTPGAIATPTAGLHFSRPLLDDLSSKGVEQIHITLHVGPGTFIPVQTNDIRHHHMHTERYHISETAVGYLNKPAKGRRIVVGTTCCRTLEDAASRGAIQPGFRETGIFIYPGYRFHYVQHLITNFHLPESTLLMLVCAFAGYELTMEAYRKAVERRYRFFSYGDAMLIL